MNNLQFDNEFDYFLDDNKSRVFQYFPKIFHDKRGYFSEVLKKIELNDDNKNLDWFLNINWIK